MAKRKRKNDEKLITNKIKNGYGQGILADYKPWIQIQDFASEGVSSRVFGWKTGREHHFLSKLEMEYFFLLEWSKQIIDIREQFPLDLDETKALAKLSNIDHPPKSNPAQPAVLTTDFLITVDLPIGTKEYARTIKYSKDLNSKRVLEKFEIEREYWSRRSINWGIVTELDIDSILSNNIKTIHSLLDIKDSYPEIQTFTIDESKAIMSPLLDMGLPVCEAAKICDEKLSLKSGASLTIAQHLIATRQWKIDMTQPFPFETATTPALPLKGGTL